LIFKKRERGKDKGKEWEFVDAEKKGAPTSSERGSLPVRWGVGEEHLVIQE